MTRKRFWAEWTHEDFRAANMAEMIVVLPVAAIEQHGPHLPVGVDAYIMQGYLDRVGQRLPEDLPVLFLPPQWIGTSDEHKDFSGTLTLSPQTAMAQWTQIGESVARAGCRKLVILNSHGGNSPVVDLVAQDLRARLGMLAVRAAWSRFGYPDGLFSVDERVHGVHGGDIETSLMQAFRPDLVRRAAIEDFSPISREMEMEYLWLRAHRPIGIGWQAQDLHPSGAAGDPRLATRDKGEACADYGATALIELLRDVEAFDLARLKSGPG